MHFIVFPKDVLIVRHAPAPTEAPVPRRPNYFEGNVHVQEVHAVVITASEQSIVEGTLGRSHQPGVQKLQAPIELLHDLVG